MKILVITPFFYPHIGGSQYYIENLYKEIIDQDSSIHVDIVTYNTKKGDDFEKMSENMTVFRVPCFEIIKDQFVIPNYFQLFKLLKQLNGRNQYSFINSHTRFFESSWWAPFLAKKLGIKSLLSDHCSSTPRHHSRIVALVAEIVDRFLFPIIGNSYDAVHVVSKKTGNFLQKLGVNKPPIFITYGGVDKEFLNNKKSVKKESQIISLSFVGRLISTKNARLFLDIARNFSKNTNLKFFIAGDGPLSKKLKKEYGDLRNVVFLGDQSKSQVRELLSKTDIFLFTSIHHEGLPFSVLEAGSQGCVIISTNMGGTSEVIKNGINGLLAKPTATDFINKINFLIKDKNSRDKLSREIKKTILNQFTWEKNANQFLKNLEKNRLI